MGKCLFEEMSFGKLSVWEMGVWEIVHSENCPLGTIRRRTARWGNFFGELSTGEMSVGEKPIGEMPVSGKEDFSTYSHNKVKLLRMSSEKVNQSKKILRKVKYTAI